MSEHDPGTLDSRAHCTEIRNQSKRSEFGSSIREMKGGQHPYILNVFIHVEKTGQFRPNRLHPAAVAQRAGLMSI